MYNEERAVTARCSVRFDFRLVMPTDTPVLRDFESSLCCLLCKLELILIVIVFPLFYECNPGGHVASSLRAFI